MLQLSESSQFIDMTRFVVAKWHLVVSGVRHSVAVLISSSHCECLVRLHGEQRQQLRNQTIAACKSLLALRTNERAHISHPNYRPEIIISPIVFLSLSSCKLHLFPSHQTRTSLWATFLQQQHPNPNQLGPLRYKRFHLLKLLTEREPRPSPPPNDDAKRPQNRRTNSNSTSRRLRTISTI